MKKLFYFFLLLNSINILQAGEIQFEWAQLVNNGSSSVRINQIAVDSKDNIIAVGEFNDSAIINSAQPYVIRANPVNSNNWTSFAFKLDKNKNLIWVKQFDGSSSNFVASVHIDQRDHIYILGTFNNSIDLNPDSTSTFTLSETISGNSSQETYLVKLNSNGDFLFGKGITPTTPLKVITDNNRNIYLFGTFYNNVGNHDFDPSPTSQFQLSTSGSTDIFMCKLDSSGNFAWAQKAGGVNLDRFEDAVFNENTDEIIVSGIFHTQADFGTPTSPLILNSNGSIDSYIATYNLSGNLNWIKSFGGIYGDYATAVEHDPFNNIYITGRFNDSVDFDPGPGTYYLYGNDPQYVSDGFLLKLDGLGNFNFVKQITGTGTQNGTAIAVSSNNEIVIGGTFRDSVAFDSVANSTMEVTDDSDVFLYGISATGNYLWKHQVGGQYLETINYIVEDSENGIYFDGTFRDSIIFNLGASPLRYASAAFEDAYVAKIAPCRFVQRIDTVNSCAMSYTWPENQVSYQESGIYTHTVSSSTVCDTVVKLMVSFNSNYGDTLSVVACNSYNWAQSSSTYLNSGFYYDTLTNQAGCDSILTLDLTVNVSSYDSIDVSACNSYTSPGGKQFTSSAIFNDTLINALGCDSILTIDLSINSPTSSSQNFTACDSLISPSGKTFYSGGLYKDTISNSNGCDSVITFFLTLNNSSLTHDTVTACNSYVLNDGTTVTNSGSYDNIFTAQNGCDSIIRINLIIQNIDTSITRFGNQLIANQNGVNYQWLDCNNSFSPIPNETNQSFTPQANGLYAVEVSSICADTSACYQVLPVSLAETSGEEVKVQVFPNPFEDRIQISTTFDQEVQIEVYNNSSRIIKRINTVSNRIELNLPQSTEGVFYIHIISGNYSKYFRVIKLK